MQLLKQSTAVTLKIGPFLDSTDGVTAETALTISQADVRLSKNGGDMAQKTEITSCTHDELGVYDCPVDATDTGTLGRLRLDVQESGALPVWHEYLVVPANVYDSLVGGSDTLQADVTQWSGSAVTSGAVPAAAAGAAGGLPTVDGNNRIVGIQGTKTTLDALNDPTVASVADAVWDEAATGHTDAGKAGAQVWTDVDAILADTNELQGDWADAGRLDAILDTVAADVVGLDGAAMRGTDGAYTGTPPTAASVADAVWDETSTGHIDAGKAGAQVWTDVDAIVVDVAGLDGAAMRGTDNASTHTAAAVITALLARTGWTQGGAVMIQTLLRKLLAISAGDVARAGGVLTYKADDASSEMVHTIDDNGRTVT